MLFLASLMTCVHVASLVADDFQLTTGGRVTGDLLNPNQSPRTQYEIQTESGRLVLEKQQVVRHVVKSTALKQYEQAVAKIENTVAAHWDMAQKCTQAELWPQRDHHLQQLIKLDPTHERARQMLGYVRINGRWEQTDVWMRQQGYIRYKKRWRIPQEVAAEIAVEKRNQEQIDLKTQIHRWRTAILKGRSGASDATRELKGIVNPLATPILAELLQKKNEPRLLKMIYVEVLAKLGGGIAVDAMADRVMNDADERIQEVCLEQLAEWKSRRAIVFFVLKLQSSNNGEINQAGFSLGQMGHPDAIVPLIEALTSKHKIQVGNPNQINAGFSPGGNGGLGFGGRPKIIEQEVLNKRVHGALLLLVPEGVNYGFNKAGWKNWYAQANTPRNVSLRRVD
jgi:hypothetical protein